MALQGMWLQYPELALMSWSTQELAQGSLKHTNEFVLNQPSTTTVWAQHMLLNRMVKHSGIAALHEEHTAQLVSVHGEGFSPHFNEDVLVLLFLHQVLIKRRK